jgi:tubulin polyglutamylase TTLL6/13
MRLYVLIYGTDPTRIYIYQEGLARFATEPYEKAKKKNLKETFVHLTNYAINKNNKKFIFNTSEKSMHVGHKRSLTSIFNLLKTRGVDINSIQAKIDSLIVKTLLVGKPMLNHLYGLSQTDNLANDHCFHILGFDVMLDEHLEPLLLEVNHTPSFATDTPLDKSIKKGLIKETFLLLNVNIQTKKAKIDKKK